MTIFVEGKQSFFLASPATLLEDSRDVADSWASNHMYSNPAYKWVLAKYVEADNANSNNQYWSLADLQKSHQSIQYSPMNIMHYPEYIVGQWAAAEMMYPTGAEDSAAVPQNPYVEVLGTFWKKYFPDELAEVEKAYSTGQLACSMECVADTITCSGDAGCGKDFSYKGRIHDSYCPELNAAKSVKKFNNPHFLAGALILPPGKPGWKGAAVKELAGLVNQSVEQFDQAYEEGRKEFPDMDAAQWQGLMGTLIDQAQKDCNCTSTAGTVYKMANGTYPIGNCQDVEDAAHLVGKSGTYSAAEVKSHIISSAKKLGCTSHLPASWS